MTAPDKPLPLACVLAYALALLCVLCFGLAVERGGRGREGQHLTTK